MTEQLGRLEALDPRDVWVHEVLGIDLELDAAEHAVGGFSLDLHGRDLTNNCVLIVENQLTSTDHSHLGRLVTYAAGTDARSVVWMATSFREEHRQALDFLNALGGTDTRFFGVEIGVVRIGSSPPAPLFRLRAQPNDWHATVAAATKATSELSGKASLYLAFWTRFLERVKIERPGWTNAQKPQTANWLSMPAPFKGASSYSANFAQNGKIRTELYLDHQDPQRVVQLYIKLFAHRDAIEAVFGGPLEWEELPNRRASRIAIYRDGDVSRTEEHDQYIDWFFETGTALRNAIGAALVEL